VTSEMLNIPIVQSSKQGVIPNAAPSDTVEAPKPTTNRNSSGDELGSSQTTKQQDIQAGHY
ncbi:hypothetical protein HAX54_035897, partial [Datura stramonium]|nr:hypothetical protein [Datura stramonium]